MRFRFLGFSILSVAALSAAVTTATAQRLIAAAGRGGDASDEITLFDVNINTGAATPFATFNAGAGQEGLAPMTFVPTKNELWILTSNGDPNTYNNGHLLRYNLSSGLVGSFPIGGMGVGAAHNVQGIEYHPQTNEVWVSWAPDPNPNQFLNKRVAKLANDGTITAVSGFSLPGIRDDIDGLAWNPVTNEMWVEDFNHFIDGEGWRLGVLNDPFGAGYSVTDIRPGLVRNLDTGDIAISDDGRVFTLNRRTNSLEEVVGNGFVTIGPLGNNPDYDGTWSSLAFVPEPGSLVLLAFGALALRRR